MSKLLSLLIAAVFAAVTYTAVAADEAMVPAPAATTAAPAKAETKAEVKKEKKAKAKKEKKAKKAKAKKEKKAKAMKEKKAEEAAPAAAK